MFKISNLYALAFFAVSSLSAEIINITQDDDSLLVKKSDSKPMVIDFYADWCGPCKMMAPIFESVSQELEDTYEFAKVNVDECKKLAEKYGVESMPTCVVVKNGQMVGKFSGLMEKEALKSKIAEIIEGPRNLAELSDEEKSAKLFEVMSQGNISEIKKVIESGVDVNASFENGWTPLLFSVVVGPQVLGDNLKEVVSLLVDAGASLEVDMNGEMIHMKDFIGSTIENFKSIMNKYELLLPYFQEISAKESKKSEAKPEKKSVESEAKPKEKSAK